MAVDLNGYWKSVYNNKLKIKEDGGKYEITQTKNKLVISGKNKKLGWKNIGCADINNIDVGSKIEIFWIDTQSSKSPECKKEHICEIEIISADKTETQKISSGNLLSFGTWERISCDEYYAD